MDPPGPSPAPALAPLSRTAEQRLRPSLYPATALLSRSAAVVTGSRQRLRLVAVCGEAHDGRGRRRTGCGDAVSSAAAVAHPALHGPQIPAAWCSVPASRQPRSSPPMAAQHPQAVSDASASRQRWTLSFHRPEVRCNITSRGPKTIKLFSNKEHMGPSKNKEHMGFSNVNDYPPSDTLELSSDHLIENKPLPLKYVKFQNVHSVDTTNMKDLKKIEEH